MREYKKVQVITKRTLYQLFIEQKGDPRLRELVERGAPEIEWVIRSDRENREAQAFLRSFFEREGIRAVWGYAGEGELWPEAELLIALGGDGTILEAAKLLDRADIPLLGLHSTPTASIGFLCSGSVRDFPEILEELRRGQLNSIEAIRIKVELNGKELPHRALNDILFAHPSPAATSKYRIRNGPLEEEQRSSGVWISTPLGSTAATYSAGGQIMPIAERRLQFVVREPYKNERDYQLVQGFFDNSNPLQITSTMPEAKLFLDGPRDEYPLYFGDELTFKIDERPIEIFTGRRFRKKLEEKR